jgi:hypothetical protein
VIEVVEPEVVHRASTDDAAGTRPQAVASKGGATGHGPALAPLTDVPVAPWRVLAERAIEPNGYYLPDWELAVNAFASGRTGASALCAWSETPLVPDGVARLIGLLPVISMWRAYKIPLPALVSTPGAMPMNCCATRLAERS